MFNKLKLTHVSNGKGVPILITPLNLWRNMKITKKNINLSEEKLKKLFFNTPCVTGKEKTEKDFKIFYLPFEFAKLKKVANTNYKRHPKNYEEKISRYKEIKQIMGGY